MNASLQEVHYYFDKVIHIHKIAQNLNALPRDYFIHVPTSKLMARLIYNVHTDQSISDYLI